MRIPIRKAYRSPFFFLIVMNLTPLADSQVEAERILSMDGYHPGVAVEVEIALPEHEDPVTVVETPPAGWEIVYVHTNRIAAGGESENGSITWDVLPMSRTWILKYTVIPPRDSSGNAVFTGHAADAPIGGMSTMGELEPEPLGIFENHLDLSTVPPGDASYDAFTGEYVTKGGGRGNRGANGHIAYSEISGPFIFEAKIRTESNGIEWGSFLIVLDYYAYESPYYGAWMSLSGEAWADWVTNRGDMWEGIDSIPPDQVEGHVKIERDGDLLRSYYLNSKTEAWTLMDSRSIPLADPVIVGLGSWSDVISADAFVTGRFTDVKLTQGQPSAVGQWDLYR